MQKISHQQWYYQLVENFDTHLQTINQIYPSPFFLNIARYCKLVIMGTLGMSGLPTKNISIDL